MSKDEEENIFDLDSTPKRTRVRKKKGRKVIKRKPGETKPSANYFTTDTQDSIVKYQNETNPKLRERIYTEEILPAYNSLVENLINVYGFNVTHESKKDLKNECLAFLYTTVEKYDVSKGSKAFSYFNVIAKNWLTIKSKQNVKRIKTYVSSDHKEDFSASDLAAFESFNVVPSYEDMLEQAEMKKTLKKVVKELEKRARTDNEVATIDAIGQIVNNLDDIDILNKRAILLYIREITDLSSKQLSVCLSNLKKHYKELKKNDEI